MDYIYGILNEKVKAMNYRGLVTDTATTKVDNSAGTISVTTKMNNSTVKSLINTAIKSLDFTDTEEDGKFVTIVDEVDGIISVSRKSVSDIINSAIKQYIPEQPLSDGTFTLKVKVENGEATYYWDTDVV